jgi:carboxylesterase type B
MAAGSELASPGFGVGEALADKMSSYWVNFAKNGDPNGKGLPLWPGFKSPDLGPHIIGEVTDCPGPDVLKPYDEQYMKLLAGLTPAR